MSGSGDRAPRAGSAARGYWLVAAVLVATSLALFAVLTAVDVPLLTDPLPVLDAAHAPVAALIGVGLLVTDVLLPVPSSAVMLAHGALFGVLPGAALSLLGGLGATVVGFALGRSGREAVARVTTAQQRATADRLLRRWGALGIAATRPIPVLAETVAVLAGTSSMRWSVAALAGAAGTVVPAVVLAWAGARAGNGPLTVAALLPR